MKSLNHSRFLLSFRLLLTHRIVMPIAREHRWLYPIDWRELSNLIRFRRAKGRCEHCRRPHGRDGLCCKHGARPRGVTQLGD